MFMAVTIGFPEPFDHKEKWSPSYHEFIRRCLVLLPAERASANELLDHPFIKDTAHVTKAQMKKILTSAFQETIQMFNMWFKICFWKQENSWSCPTEKEKAIKWQHKSTDPWLGRIFSDFFMMIFFIGKIFFFVCLYCLFVWFVWFTLMQQIFFIFIFKLSCLNKYQFWTPMETKEASHWKRRVLDEMANEKSSVDFDHW